jgi:hypothetical protein
MAAAEAVVVEITLLLALVAVLAEAATVEIMVITAAAAQVD